MKSIYSLVPDIYALVGTKGWFTDDIARELSHNISLRLQAHLGDERGPPTLRLSKMGPECPCALWNSIHHPELAEPLPPWATIKYSYGHILEALVIALAKAAGHEVTGEQDAIILDGIVGHRDAIIDGCLVDVKSSSSRSFTKFKDKSLGQSDSFGYLDQLDGYVVGSQNDPLLAVKDKGFIVAIDKQLGHLVLYEHTIRTTNIHNRIELYKNIVGRTKCPACDCGTEPDGKSGNIKLNVKASYSAFKHCCFPFLRTFLYADGPRYLSEVKRKPEVTEVDKHGSVIYRDF